SGRLTGGVDGGARGFDTLVLDVGTVQEVVSTATGPNSGSISYDAAVMNYHGLEPVDVIGQVPTYTVDISNLDGSSTGNNIANLLWDPTHNGGMMEMQSVNSHFENQFFQTPTKELIIKADTGTDDIRITSLDPGWSKTALTIQTLASGYNPFDQGGLLPS